MIVTFDTSLTPAAVGQFISIATTDGGSSANFDLYSLDATPVPEPGSAMAAAAALAPVALRRRVCPRSA